VGTASGLLSAEIPVGTTPGGELGNTWASPTVDATHSGSTHAAAQAAAEATAAGALSGHVASGDPHTGYRLESADHSHASTGAQGGTVDHGALTGLSDDDHPQYATNAEFDDHSARHEDGGADEISLAALSGTPAALQAHLDDTSAAHAASAIGFTPNGSIAATDVQAAIQEVRDEAGGSAPPDQYEAFLTSPVTMVNAATFYDGPSLSLPVGSYQVTVEAECSNAHASNTYQTIRIYDGTTVWKARGSWSSGGAGGVQCLQATARVTLAGTTTVKLQVADLRASSNGVILDTATNSGTTDKCTSITAVKVTPI
jgi:hypothetical protein